MTDDDEPLTERQQMMMAYVDEELDRADRAAFERAMASDPDLAMETVKFKNLIDLSRSMSLSEPSDHELRRFWSGFYNRTEWQLGWALLTFGVIVTLGWGIYWLVVESGLPWILIVAVLSVVAGGGLLVWNAARLKLRTSQFDRYRGVMR